MTKNESAFPNEFGYGMTLRDWFAGQYLIGMSHPRIMLGPQEIAEECYELADAMLKARGQ